MRAVHGLILTLGLSTGALAGAVVFFGASPQKEDPSRPDQGVLAPALPHPVPTVVAVRMGGEAGPVLDVAASGPDLAVLTRHQWYLRRGDSLKGGFGDPTPGSPGWLSRPESIALGRGRVYILDAGRKILSVWDTSGVRTRDIPLSHPEGLSVLPAQVVMGPGGEPLVVSFLVSGDGAACWEARAFGEGEPGRVVVSWEGGGPSQAFDRPHLAAWGDLLLGVRALERGFFRVPGGAGRAQPYREPSPPPLWRVPRLTRERYNALVQSRGGGGYPELLELPPFWPSVRDFTVTPEGALLLAVPTGEERQHLELLDPEGKPRFRFNGEGYLDPLFLDGGRAFLVREDLNETVIHEFVFQPY